MTDVLTSAQARMSPEVKAASKAALRRAIAVAVLMLGGVGAVYGLEDMLNARFTKPPAELNQPLSEMSRRIGRPTRYVADKSDTVLEHEIVETLGTNDYLVREYHDLTVKRGEVGEYVNLNLNYYATGSSSPHVPEVCWAGAGQVEAPGSGETFEIPNVARKYGPPVTLRVRLISFLPPKITAPGTEAPAATANGEPLYTNVAYIFHVNGEYVSNPREVTSHFWKASNLYAYHSKIEITPMVEVSGISGTDVRPALCTRAQAKEIVTHFLQSALVDVETCLPDPAILTAPSPASSAAGTSAPPAAGAFSGPAGGTHESANTR